MEKYLNITPIAKDVLDLFLKTFFIVVPKKQQQLFF